MEHMRFKQYKNQSYCIILQLAWLSLLDGRIHLLSISVPRVVLMFCGFRDEIPTGKEVHNGREE